MSFSDHAFISFHVFPKSVEMSTLIESFSRSWSTEFSGAICMKNDRLTDSAFVASSGRDMRLPE